MTIERELLAEVNELVRKKQRQALDRKELRSEEHTSELQSR